MDINKEVFIKIGKWLKNDHLNDQELGKKVREFYWDIISEVKQGK